MIEPADNRTDLRLSESRNRTEDPTAQFILVGGNVIIETTPFDLNIIAGKPGFAGRVNGSVFIVIIQEIGHFHSGSAVGSLYCKFLFQPGC